MHYLRFNITRILKKTKKQSKPLSKSTSNQQYTVTLKYVKYFEFKTRMPASFKVFLSRMFDFKGRVASTLRCRNHFVSVRKS